MSNLVFCPYRFGFTGTLDGSKVHEMQCRAWFGPIIRTSSTKDLIDKGILSELKVEIRALQYPDEEKRIVKRMDYQAEIDFLISHPKRNDYLIETALSTPNNTLLLFSFIDKHGEELFRRAKMKAEEKGKEIFKIVGEVKAEEREEIRQKMESQNNIVVFATYGTMALGINIKNLHFLILSHPYKARIRILQSIGRTLRKLTSKTRATIIDIMDDLRIGNHTNLTYKHGIERMKIYESEEHNILYMKEELYERV